MSIRDPRPLRFAVVLILLTGMARGQTLQRAIVFTSEDSHVNLPEGMKFSLQSEAPAGGTPWALPLLPPGQLLQTTLRHSVRGSSAKPGDPVEFTLDYPIHIQADEGGVSVPAGAKIVGHVTGTAARDESSPRSRLGVVFERLVSGARQWSVCLKVVGLKGAKPFVNDPGQAKAYVAPQRPKRDAQSMVSHVRLGAGSR